MIKNCEIGEKTKVWQPGLVNLYGCKIGRDCVIGAFVEIGRDVVIGDRCKIQSGAFIPEGVLIGDDVFIGPNVTFTNDKHPQAGRYWELSRTRVEKHANVGANATILPGLVLGRGCMVGAGAVVTRSVPAGEVVVGVPARPLEDSKDV